MPDDTITDATEKILRASQLQQPMRDSLKSQFEKATKGLGTPGFHRFDDIDTLVGLGGVFLWPEDPFAIRTITFTFDTDKVGTQGRYKIVSGVFTVEEGVFVSIPNNPAIGFAFLNLTPQGGSTVVSRSISVLAGRFGVLGYERDHAGLVIFGVSRREERRSSGSTRSPLTDFSPPELRCRFILPSPIRVSPRSGR